jgi:hypothetical protein
MLRRPLGSISMDLYWTKPASREAADWERAARSLRTELTTAVQTKRATWWLERTPSTLEIHGELPISRHLLGDLMNRAGITSIVCDDYLTLSMPGMVTDTAALDSAIKIVELVCAPEASQSPFR